MWKNIFGGLTTNAVAQEADQYLNQAHLYNQQMAAQNVKWNPYLNQSVQSPAEITNSKLSFAINRSDKEIAGMLHPKNEEEQVFAIMSGYIEVLGGVYIKYREE